MKSSFHLRSEYPPASESSFAQLTAGGENDSIGRVSLPTLLKIILIEDHKLVRDMLAAFCQNIVPDGKIHTASNGREGVSLCQEIQPDLIFLDLVLPDCDGLDLLAQIQAISAASKVIALT